MTLEFSLESLNGKIRTYFPRTPDNLGNISHITSIRLDFGSGMAAPLEGPSGCFYFRGMVKGCYMLPPSHRRIEPIDKFPISTTETLAILHSSSKAPNIYQTLLLMNNLRALTLDDCINTPFFLALNPAQNSSNTVACPNLEDLVLDFPGGVSCIGDLLEMAKQRASIGAKLSTIVITCSSKMISEDDLSALRNYASHVESRLYDETLPWDAFPGRADDVDMTATGRIGVGISSVDSHDGMSFVYCFYIGYVYSPPVPDSIA